MTDNLIHEAQTGNLKSISARLTPPTRSPSKTDLIPAYRRQEKYSFMKKIRQYKSRLKIWVQGTTRSDRGSMSSTPAPTEPGQDIAPTQLHASSVSFSIANEEPRHYIPRNLGKDEAPALPLQSDTYGQDVGQILSYPPQGAAKLPQTDTLIADMSAGDHVATRLSPASSPEVTNQGVQQTPPHPPSGPVTTGLAETDGWTNFRIPLDHPVKSSTSSGAGISSQVKPENWANLKELMETLTKAVGISGLVPVKNVIEGLVELIGLYEDAAQGQKELDDLRLQLECIFNELNRHLSNSPTITISMDNICWSLKKEIELVKSQQARHGNMKLESEGYDARMVLECYRRIQDHLQRLTRNANISTWKIVDQLAAENRLQKLAPSLMECYNSKKAPELKRGACTAGTRTSILAQVHQWATSPDTGNIFWMSGMAGTGKTTIAYSLCEKLAEKANRILCASFFCSRSVPECRDIGRIIPSIAYQLARCSQPFQYALSQATEQDPDAYTRLPQVQFEVLIEQPLSDVKVKEAFPSNMVVVIDALDECDDVKSTKLILEVLLTRSRNLPIKFVVSSRPEAAIRDQMEKNDTWVDSRAVLHELNSEEVQADIKAYLGAELGPIKPSEVEIQQLVERAGVLFIYAATVIRYVGYDDFRRNPRARLKALLAKTSRHVKAQTKDIDELYGFILDAAFEDSSLTEDERGDMKLTLDTVVCAREPLTVAALNGLLKLGDIDRVHAAIRPFWSVLHVTGSSLTVGTLHASFPEYLLDSKRSGTWHCHAAAHHHLLAQRCFDCIQDTKPEFNVCRLESSYLIDEEVVDLDARVQNFISIELQYACRYWSGHLDAADSSTVSRLIPLLSHFLATHLLLWIEVRNLTKSMVAAVGELSTVKKWAIRYGMPRDAINLLSDAWRFTSTFASSPVSRSTPHIYISMLPLLLPYSPIRNHYLNRFQAMIGAEGTALNRRSGALLAQWEFDLEVRCIVYSPNGTRIAIGGETGGTDRILLLDASSGDLVLDLSRGDKVHIHDMAFSPDNSRLAAGRSDGIISILDVTDGRAVIDPFKPHNHRISSILYSHGGSFIVSASWDTTIRIWDALSGSPALPPLIGHTRDVTCIAISSDDTRLVSGSDDFTIRVWDIHSGQLILDPITAHDDRVYAIALSPDDSYIVAGLLDGNIGVWDIQTGQMVHGLLRDRGRWARSLSISPNGNKIASTSDIDGVRIWDAASGKIISQLGPFSDNISSTKWASYSPDGTRITFAREDGTIRLLGMQAAAVSCYPPSGHTRSIASIDISPNSRYLVSGSYDDTLCVWDLKQGTLLVGPLRGHTEPVFMVRFSADGSRIVSCAGDSTIRQWDAQSGAAYLAPIKVTLSESMEIFSVNYSPDGTLILSLMTWATLSVWDSNTGQRIVGPMATSSQSRGVHADFSPDGATVIIGYQDASIGVWDLQSGQMVYSHGDYGDSDVLSLALSPDGLYYAQSFEGGTISLRNMHTKLQIPGNFDGHPDYITPVRFSSDSTQLVSGSDNNAVRIWDVETRQSLSGPLNGHTKAITSVAFASDGKHVVSASSDLAIRVWSTENNRGMPSREDRDVEYADWVLNKDGWVVSGESRRLFWVPGDLRPSLMSPRNTALISRDGYLRLSFEGASIGREWTSCWRDN